MDGILAEIRRRQDLVAGRPGFLDVLFGKRKEEALHSDEVVLFGAGSLGAEMCSALRRHGVYPRCFCDNDPSLTGSRYCGIPVISYDELRRSSGQGLIVVASHKHMVTLTQQLLAGGFHPEQVFCQHTDPSSPFLFMYCMIGTQDLFDIYRRQCHPHSVMEVLCRHEQELGDAYALLADEHSRELLLDKLALMSSAANYSLFVRFIRKFSQPVRNWGLACYEGTPEDYFYFTNDIFELRQGEVYIDVGAYDGDTVCSFRDACMARGVEFKQIHAFEPDPECFAKLRLNTRGLDKVACHQKGVWESSGKVRFKSSGQVVHDQAATIDPTGDLEIDVVGLDEYLSGEGVTLIKMDPGGDVVPAALRGAAGIIRRQRPRLVLGAYHSVKSMFEIPLLVNDLCPRYRIFLRHNTYHLCDTDLLAIE